MFLFTGATPCIGRTLPTLYRRSTHQSLNQTPARISAQKPAHAYGGGENNESEGDGTRGLHSIEEACQRWCMDSPSPPADIDSASTLLAALDLIGTKKTKNNPQKIMDEMDMDYILEIPDTPDRLPVTREPERPPRRRGCGPCGAAGGSNNPQDDIAQFFHQANLARNISDALDGKPSPSEARAAAGGSGGRIDAGKRILFPAPHPVRCGNLGRKSGKDMSVGGSLIRTREEEIIDLSDSVDRVRGRGFEFVDLSSAITPVPSSYHTRSREQCGENADIRDFVSGNTDVFDGDYNGLRRGDKGKGIDLDSLLEVSRRTTGKRRLVRNGCISPCNTAKRSASAQVDGRMTTDSSEISSPFPGIRNQSKDKGIEWPSDVEAEVGQVPIRQLRDDPPPRNTRQRRLVRNGCISPLNIAKNMNAGKPEDGVGKNGFEEIPDTLSSQLIQIISPNTEGSRADKKKGKVMLSSGLAAESQDGIANRECLTSGKDLTITGDGDDNNWGCSEDSGWRTTRNRTGSNPNRGGSSSDLRSESRRQRGLQNHLKEKRKCSVLHSNVGESSSSSFEGPKISNLQSAGQRSSSNSTKKFNSQQHRGMLGPIIEVDELLSPEVSSSYSEERSRRISDDSSATARQVESDEMLARRLQEEFYHESPEVGIAEEIDAGIALLLQQEDAQHAAAFATLGQSHSRNTSTTRSYASPLPLSSFRNSPARSNARARGATRNAMRQLSRNFARHEMDLETRIEFWEAMEAAFDSGDDIPISGHVLHGQHDFNENDYETLLSLDENNHQHSGATDRQINALPQSVVQSDNNAEDCAVCLETPSVGDIVRHLPCLHKFHKECIDTWLRRKTSCPICKSGIT